eukprot:COSAG02_NODE_18566_length_932_cov_0.804322_1_plen_229_part_00
MGGKRKLSWCLPRPAVGGRNAANGAAGRVERRVAQAGAMIRVNMLGRACAAVALLAFVVVVYRLHSLASRLEHDLQMRHIARDMLRDDELDSHSAGIASSAISAREHDAHAQVGRTTDEAAHPANAAEQSRAPGGRWAGLEELHRDWDMYVVNLDKRPDRLACVMQEFNRLGMRVNRLRGIDGTQLDLDDLSLVTPEYHSVETVSNDAKYIFAVSCARHYADSVTLVW